jgi:hypothetical protein
MAKKVGSTADYIIPIGLLALAGLVLWKLGIFNGTATGTGANNKLNNDTTAASAAADWATAGGAAAQTISDTQINSMIGAIMSDIGSNTSIFSGSSYQNDVVNQMSNLGSMADLMRMYMLWGTRAVPTQEFNLCNTLDIDCSTVDLGTALHVTLTPAQLATVNQDLAGNGINYVFN